MRVVSPIGQVQKVETRSAVLDSLEGKTVGFLTNGWRSWEHLIARMQSLLTAEQGVGNVRRWDIPVSVAAPDEVIDESVRVCDLCVVGLGN